MDDPDLPGPPAHPGRAGAPAPGRPLHQLRHHQPAADPAVGGVRAQVGLHPLDPHDRPGLPAEAHRADPGLRHDLHRVRQRGVGAPRVLGRQRPRGLPPEDPGHDLVQERPEQQGTTAGDPRGTQELPPAPPRAAGGQHPEGPAGGAAGDEAADGRGWRGRAGGRADDEDLHSRHRGDLRGAEHHRCRAPSTVGAAADRVATGSPARTDPQWSAGCLAAPRPGGGPRARTAAFRFPGSVGAAGPVWAAQPIRSFRTIGSVRAAGSWSARRRSTLRRSTALRPGWRRGLGCISRGWRHDVTATTHHGTTNSALRHPPHLARRHRPARVREDGRAAWTEL